MNKKKIYSFLNNNLKKYEVVYITSDLRGLLFNQVFNNANELCLFFLKYFLKRKKTIIVPTFSFTNKGKFYIETTPTNLSFFSKWILKQKKVMRSSHPIFSASALGPKKKIVENIGKSAFGKNSIYQKMLFEKSCLLHIGRPFELGNTSIHYVEELVGAEYRYLKKFKTKVYKKGKFFSSGFSAFVRKRKIKTTNTLKIAKIFRKKKLIKEIGDRNILTNISIIDYKKSINTMIDSFKKDKRVFLN